MRSALLSGNLAVICSLYVIVTYMLPCILNSFNCCCTRKNIYFLGERDSSQTCVKTNCLFQIFYEFHPSFYPFLCLIPLIFETSITKYNLSGLCCPQLKIQVAWISFWMHYSISAYIRIPRLFLCILNISDCCSTRKAILKVFEWSKYVSVSNSTSRCLLVLNSRDWILCCIPSWNIWLLDVTMGNLYRFPQYNSYNLFLRRTIVS